MVPAVHPLPSKQWRPVLCKVPGLLGSSGWHLEAVRAGGVVGAPLELVLRLAHVL